MSDGNDTKTREQLLAEIAALKQQLGQRATDGDQPESTASAPVFSGSITRRESLVSWVAPVILSLPVVQGLGMVLKPGTAQAAYPVDDFIAPTFHAPTFHAPSVAPTAPTRPTPTLHAPTFRAPTLAPPTAAPTAAATAEPTAAPTATPTRAGRCIVTPTVAPTLGMASAPDSRPSPAGVIALGSARALSRARIGT